MTMFLHIISSILVAILITINIFHIRLMLSLKDNRDFIVYFAGAINTKTNESLEKFTAFRLRTACWIYAGLYLSGLFIGLYGVIPLVLSCMVFLHDLYLYRPFWFTLFPRLCRARYYPIDPLF